MNLYILLVLAAVFRAACSGGLVDHPIAGDTLVYLDGTDWQASTPANEIQMAATVPGDLISDLFRAGLIADPLFDNNFLNSTLWDDRIWTYQKSFTVEDSVIDGLRTSGGACAQGAPCCGVLN